jgi:osmotically-inducible protein OsmY
MIYAREETRMNRILILLIAFSLCLGALIGCGKEAPPTPSSIQALDSSEKVAVRAAFNTDPDVAAQKIEISVFNKAVTLTGTVASEELKKKAESLAANSPGILKVVNKLEVEAKKEE